MRAHLHRVTYLVTASLLLAAVSIATCEDRQSEYLQLRVLVGEQRFSEALDRCKVLIAKYPDYVYLYESMAEIALYAQDLGSAARFFEERIDDGTSLELSYFGLGTVYFDMAAYREASLCFDRAIELGITAPECYRNFTYAYERLEGVDASIRFFNSLCHRDPKNPHLWYAVALAYWSKRDYPTVLKNLDEALIRNPNEPKYLQARAAVLLLMGRVREGADLTSRLMAIADRENDLSGVQFLSSYDVLRQDREKSGNLGNALAIRSLDVAKLYGQFRWIGWWNERLASLDYWRCLFLEALKHSEIALEAARKCSDNLLALDALIRKVESSMDLGRYAPAIEFAYQELEISRNEKDNGRIARSLTDLAGIYHELGMDDIAMDYAIEALAMSENTKSSNELLMRIYTTLGLIYGSLENHEAALASLTAADQLMPKGGVWIPNQAVSHGNIGRVYLELGDLKRARYHFVRENELSKSALFSREEAYSLINLAEWCVRVKQIRSARALYMRGYELSQKIGQRPTILASTLGLARLASQSGKYAEAVTWYDNAFAVAESMGLIWEGRLLASRRKNLLDQDIKRYVDLLVSLGQDISAFNFFERYKFSSESYGLNWTKSLRELTPETRRSLDSLVQDQSARWCSVARPIEPGIPKGSRYDLRVLPEVVLSDIRLHKLLENLQESSPNTYKAHCPRAATLSEVQKYLKCASDGIVEYVVGEKVVLAFIIGVDTFHVIRLNVTPSELQALVGHMANLFNGSHEASQSWSASFANFDNRACAEAYRKILKPVIQTVPSIKHLTIIPDGPLAGIPFECFVDDESPSTGFVRETFIINRLALDYSTTASNLVFQRRAVGQTSQSLLAVGNPDMNGMISELMVQDSLSLHLAPTLHGLPPLPGAEREVIAIQNEFQGDATILLGKDATKKQLKALIPDYEIVHFAAHASVRRDWPLGSAIVLSCDGASNHPGFLSAWELSECNIRARLVVLSSCNTMKFYGGLDEAGFSRGLTQAGVPSIVGCLWSVDDNSSAQLMARFYHHLWAGQSLAVALQKAKVELINSGKADPYYWAPFVLFGESSPLRLPPSKNNQGVGWQFGVWLAAIVFTSITISWFWSLLRKRSESMTSSV